MRRTSLVLAVLATVVIGATVGFGPLFGAPGLTVVRMFIDADPIGKLMDMLLCLLLAAVLLIGVIQLLADRTTARSEFLSVMTFVGPLLALLAAAGAVALNLSVAVRYANRINVAVLGPGISEALMSLSLGLLIGVTASLLNDLMAARMARKPG